MNIHITDKIKKDWQQYEFIGKPFEKNGKTYIRAKHKVWWQGQTHIFCIEDQWFWHDISVNQLP